MPMFPHSNQKKTKYVRGHPFTMYTQRGWVKPHMDFIIIIINSHRLSARRCPMPVSSTSSNFLCLTPSGSVSEATSRPTRWCRPAIPCVVFPLVCALHSSKHQLLYLPVVMHSAYVSKQSYSFLPISFCMIFSFSCMRLYKSMFFTFSVHPILSIFL